MTMCCAAAMAASENGINASIEEQLQEEGAFNTGIITGVTTTGTDFESGAASPSSGVESLWTWVQCAWLMMCLAIAQ